MTITTTLPSPRQQQILDALPEKVAGLAEALEVHPSSIYAQLNRLKEKGYHFSKDDTGRYHLASTPADKTKLSGDEQPETETASETPRRSRASKALLTRKKNDHLYELEQRLYALLDGMPEIRADGGLVAHDTHEDMVVHISDDHIGSLRRDEFGNITFDDSVAATRIRARTDKVFELADREERAGTTIDTVHVLFGGDLVDGEGIYELQPHEVCLTLDRQIDLAGELYFEMIFLLSQRFPTVQVVCQAGNHGELRMKSASTGANADTIVYLMLKRLIAAAQLDNVSFIHNDSAHFVNFELRGGKWLGHLRHGQHSPAHIGTPSPKAKWGNWQSQHGFDIAYRGHYHERRIEHIFGRSRTHPDEVRLIPIIMSGSIAPPAEYEESIGVWGAPSGTVHGVTDSRVVSWLYNLDY